MPPCSGQIEFAGIVLYRSIISYHIIWHHQLWLLWSGHFYVRQGRFFNRF